MRPARYLLIVLGLISHGNDARGQTPSLTQLLTEIGISREPVSAATDDSVLTRATGHGARQAEAYPNPTVSAEVEDWERRIGGQEELIQAAKRLALAREIEQAVATKMREGAVPESEARRATASRSLAQVDSLSAESVIEGALTELATLTGASLSGVRGEGDLTGSSPLSLPDSLRGILRAHPLVMAQTAEHDARGKDALLARALGKSDLTVSTGCRRLHDASDNGVLFGVSIPLPIRNPNAAGIAESDVRIAAAEAALRQVMLEFEIESEIRTPAVAWERRSQAIAMVQTQTLPSIDQSLTSLDLACRVGQQPYMNLLDVQRAQSELQARLIDAMVAKTQVESRLESLLGQRVDTTER